MMTAEESSRVIDESDQDIEVTLWDDSVIQVDAYHYLFVDRPGRFLYGRGELINTLTNESKEHAGVMYPIRVDSGSYRKSTSWSGYRMATYYDCWISESVKVRINGDDLLTINSDTIPRFWYIEKTETLPIVTRNVPKDEIQGVRTVKYSSEQTAANVAGLALGWGVAAAAGAILVAYMVLEIFRQHLEARK